MIATGIRYVFPIAMAVYRREAGFDCGFTSFTSAGKSHVMALQEEILVGAVGCRSAGPERKDAIWANCPLLTLVSLSDCLVEDNKKNLDEYHLQGNQYSIH